MAVKLINMKCDYLEADGASVVGKIVNVYNTYANALTHGEDGLCTIYAATVLTGAQGAAITQVAKTTGVTIDNNGLIRFYVDDAEYTEVFLISVAGRQSGPIRVVVQ
jgi:hypothetical protein